MEVIVNFIENNALLLGFIHVVALVLVNVTPTPAADSLPGKLYKVLELVAGLVTKTSKEQG